jgi:hypothetical protein
MKLVRRLARALYSRAFVSGMSVTVHGTEGLDPRALRSDLGGHDRLHIAAPGASVSRFDAAPGSLADADVLGVNYFVTCSNVPLWPEARLFVIEPHETYRSYAQALASAMAAKQSCFVIVKGTGSPSKVLASARLVRAVARIPGTTVLLSRDTYVSDLPQADPADAIVSHPDGTVSGFKTLLWVLSFAYVAGYREIVLHGFDFSQDYAYADARQKNEARIQPNTWVSDEANRSSILGQVARLGKLFSERGIRLTQSGCDGPLATLLPPYVAERAMAGGAP